MAVVKPAPVNPNAWCERLIAIKEAYIKPMKFEIGDLITHNPIVYPSAMAGMMLKAGVVPINIVLETFESYRKMCNGDQVSTEMQSDCQAILVGEITAEGETINRWFPSWTFIKATPEIIRSFSPDSTNLNH